MVDDRVYSRTWIQLRTRKSPLGRGALRQGLLRKGVDPQAVRASLDEWDEATLREGARQYVMRLVRQGVSRERIFARMARRGFGPAKVRQLLEEDPERTSKDRDNENKVNLLQESVDNKVRAA